MVRQRPTWPGTRLHGRLAANRNSKLETHNFLSFTLVTRGTLHPHVTADARGVEFRDEAGATVLTYAGLKVWDADGKVLSARFASLDPRDSTRLTLAVDERGARYLLTIDPIAQQAYLKASNTGADDFFGYSVAVAGDTVVVGAFFEDSAATGVDGNQADNTAGNAGAAYVFITPEIAVSGNSVDIPDGDASPALADHTDFGSVNVASGTVVRTYTIANSGTVDLTLGSVTINGTHAADFTVPLQPTSPIAPSGSTTRQVTFDPSAPGLREVTLSFSTDDADENPVDFAIQGWGAAITVTPTAGLVTTEAGDTATFTVVLTAPPTADVTIDLSSADPTEGTVASASLTFTAADWDTAQTVTVTGVDEGIVDGDIAYSIVTTATSADTVYDGIEVADVSVTNSDDGETADLAITKTDGVSSVLAGTPVNYTITGSNGGPAATAATVADTFPVACGSVAWTCTGSGGGSCTASGNGSLNDTVSLPNGGSVTYTATCTVGMGW